MLAQTYFQKCLFFIKLFIINSLQNQDYGTHFLDSTLSAANRQIPHLISRETQLLSQLKSVYVMSEPSTSFTMFERGRVAKHKRKKRQKKRIRSIVIHGAGSDSGDSPNAECRVSGHSELNSEEIKRSYKIYMEAVRLGLVPTQQDLEERVTLANRCVLL